MFGSYDERRKCLTLAARLRRTVPANGFARGSQPLRIPERAVSRLVLLDALDDLCRAGAVAFGAGLVGLLLLFSFFDQNEAARVVSPFGQRTVGIRAVAGAAATGGHRETRRNDEKRLHGVCSKPKT